MVLPYYRTLIVDGHSPLSYAECRYMVIPHYLILSVDGPASLSYIEYRCLSSLSNNECRWPFPIILHWM